jgi:hypothetical protein
MRKICFKHLAKIVILFSHPWVWALWNLHVSFCCCNMLSEHRSCGEEEEEGEEEGDEEGGASIHVSFQWNSDI